MEFLTKFNNSRNTVNAASSLSSDDIFSYLNGPVDFQQNYTKNSILNKNLQARVENGLVTKEGVEIEDIIDAQIEINRTMLQFEHLNPKTNLREINVEDVYDILNFGFISNVDLPNGGEVDDLFSIVVSLSIQKNIPLPPPILNETKIDWFKECLQRLVGSRHEDQSQKKQQLNEPETALRDLQFSHEYLAKKYQEEVKHHAKALRRIQESDSHLENVTNEMVRLARDSVNIRNVNGKLKTQLSERDQKIYELERELALLKVDRIGGNEIASPPASGSSNSSVSLLRSEFKRIVQDLNKRHAEEMERVKEMAQ